MIIPGIDEGTDHPGPGRWIRRESGHSGAGSFVN